MKFPSASSIAFVLLLALIVGVGAQTGSSFTTENSESTAVIALERLTTENERLRKELAEAQERSAQSNAEAEVFRRQIDGIKLRMEAIGVSTAGDPSKLEQRLLQAVRDLQVATKNNRLLAQEVIKLVNAASSLLKDGNEKNRLTLESTIKVSDEALMTTAVGEINKPQETPSSLMAGKISAISKLDTKAGPITCVIVNLGEQHGAKVGMPFQVRRNEQLIASVRLVDVRSNFSGAIIQSISNKKDTIQLGDNVRVDVQKP